MTLPPMAIDAPVGAGGGTIVASAVYKPPEKESSYHVISTDSMSD
jgi:hypothetical protein